MISVVILALLSSASAISSSCSGNGHISCASQDTGTGGWSPESISVIEGPTNSTGFNSLMHWNGFTMEVTGLYEMFSTGRVEVQCEFVANGNIEAALLQGCRMRIKAVGQNCGVDYRITGNAIFQDGLETTLASAVASTEPASLGYELTAIDNAMKITIDGCVITLGPSFVTVSYPTTVSDCKGFLCNNDKDITSDALIAAHDCSSSIKAIQPIRKCSSSSGPATTSLPMYPEMTAAKLDITKTLVYPVFASETTLKLVLIDCLVGQPIEKLMTDGLFAAHVESCIYDKSLGPGMEHTAQATMQAYSSITNVPVDLKTVMRRSVTTTVSTLDVNSAVAFQPKSMRFAPRSEMMVKAEPFSKIATIVTLDALVNLAKGIPDQALMKTMQNFDATVITQTTILPDTPDSLISKAPDGTTTVITATYSSEPLESAKKVKSQLHSGEIVDVNAGIGWIPRSFAFTPVSIARTRTIFGTIVCVGGPSEFLSNASFTSLLTIDGFLRAIPPSSESRQLAQELYIAASGRISPDASDNAGFQIKNPVGDGDIGVAVSTKSNLQVFKRKSLAHSLTIFVPGPSAVQVVILDTPTGTTMTYVLPGRDELPKSPMKQVSDATSASRASVADVVRAASTNDRFASREPSLISASMSTPTRARTPLRADVDGVVASELTAVPAGFAPRSEIGVQVAITALSGNSNTTVSDQDAAVALANAALLASGSPTMAAVPSTKSELSLAGLLRDAANQPTAGSKAFPSKSQSVMAPFVRPTVADEVPSPAPLKPSNSEIESSSC